MFFTRKSSILFICFWTVLYTLKAQDNWTGYWQPQLALNYKVTANYSHNFSLAKRTYLYQDSALDFEIRQLDFVHFSKLKISDNQSLGLGLQYRFRENFEQDKENELRITQQYNITHKARVLRFGHRLRTEQRITASATIHRFRYRFALDLPLQGVELDIGESYLVLTTESLLSAGKATRPEYDQRITAQLGWLISEKTKFQLGAEYRAENYNAVTENVAFLITNLVLSL